MELYDLCPADHTSDMELIVLLLQLAHVITTGLINNISLCSQLTTIVHYILFKTVDFDLVCRGLT